MAKRTIITLTDDLDGSDAEETISFSVDGTAYEIDLNADNARNLRAALRTFRDERRSRPGRPAPTRLATQKSGPGPRKTASGSSTGEPSAPRSLNSTTPHTKSGTAGAAPRPFGYFSTLSLLARFILAMACSHR
ncbi:Lsr2 family protein [Pseudarthrobacter sp. NamB4]|nr:Lsr2 family protein [Pseudarthrobacter sp. NamB4]